ncbi:MAG: nucleotide sugar dehydrogenase [Rhodospirillaceae bacterium]|jgi:UDP-N-acetyl-D-glucosamine dehydrogenase|nr:nucleotide sugar dehydrogenase [Rhodospirillaceae bacterium]MBT6205326.1 nucleotide sugar dehydrogenase [Rhodospirillaceae bacterium]MBT6510527.1 nucleotide sugar dehydrogenase [Rhodospirillaceae bacterium]
MNSIESKITTRDACVAVVGLGYVGLPLVLAAHKAGFCVLGFDTDPEKITRLSAGVSYIRHIGADNIAAMVAAGRFRATDEVAALAQADVILICVPTPLTANREPDMRYVEETTRAIASVLRKGQMIILESTTYPGTTEGLMKPILEASGLVSGSDFLLAYSPEREDPGNAGHSTTQVPKVVGGDGDAARDAACAFYETITTAGTVPVTDTKTAEAVKLMENIFRSVNIALVNELKLVYGAMGIDIWEVIEAAKSKPFGYMPFYPGPGLGGHCIPIDPFYLTWKAREFEVATRFIELAGEINTAMPAHVVARLGEELDRRFAKGLNGAKIVLIGMAYKKNVDDIRESPALKLIALLEARGAEVSFYDPFIPVIRTGREHAELSGRESLTWEAVVAGNHDAALIVTDHDDVDYGALIAAMPLVVDTRNATGDAGALRERIAHA